MSSEKYIGLDVHQATISVAVLDSTGKLVMESILETKAATILEFFAGLRGTLSVTFEEGTWAAWLYDVLKPHVGKLVVCNPRKNALLKDGNKSDRIDAHKLAELLYLNKLSSVYHGETGVRILRELARSYLTIVKDLTRVMCRLKAVYRSWAIPCAGRDVYYTRHRDEWLDKIKEAGVRRQTMPRSWWRTGADPILTWPYFGPNDRALSGMQTAVSQRSKRSYRVRTGLIMSPNFHNRRPTCGDLSMLSERMAICIH
jgi:transposase